MKIVISAVFILTKMWYLSTVGWAVLL